MNGKDSKLGYVIAFLFVVALGFSIYWLFLKPEPNDDNKANDLPTNTQNEEEKKVDDTPVIVDNDPVVNDDPITTDFSDFSNTTQNVGSSSNKEKYTIKSLTDSKQDGFHSFVFVVQGATSEVMDTPYIVAKYNPTLGAIRVDLNGISKDESGIGYQKSKKIDEQGVIKIYHNISSDSTEELYDIGISKSTTFKISSKEDVENSWIVTLDVKYPGSTAGTTSEDFGSDTFSKELQTIDGALAADSAKILSYSYSTASGVLSVVFTVSGSTSRPVPTASAQMNSESKLVLEFPEVISDSVNKSIDGKKLGNFTVDSSRSGNKSTFVFSGTVKEYKLYGSKSPNQVVLEIK
jgi:hypothetical protein